MNWIEIRKNKPKSYFALESFMKVKEGSLPFYKYAHWNNRILYDFFDENGIYIEIRYSGWHKKFDSLIMIDESKYAQYLSDKTENRTEAEEAAFIKAFEILENKLIPKREWL